MRLQHTGRPGAPPEAGAAAAVLRAGDAASPAAPPSSLSAPPTPRGPELTAAQQQQQQQEDQGGLAAGQRGEGEAARATPPVTCRAWRLDVRDPWDAAALGPPRHRDYTEQYLRLTRDFHAFAHHDHHDHVQL